MPLAMASIRSQICCKSLREACGFVYVTKPCASLKEVFQQIRERMESIVKGIVSDHWSTVIQTVTYIGFGFKNPANLGLLTSEFGDPAENEPIFFWGGETNYVFEINLHSGY